MAMAMVKSSEAKTHFSEMLDRVEHGEQIAIMRHGVHVATLVPSDDGGRKRREDAMAQILKMRDKIRREGRGLSVQEILDARDEDRK
ncbi:type II toxin-antitoxin system prevent-host-death family antitoxin [soil metagenome]